MIDTRGDGMQRAAGCWLGSVQPHARRQMAAVSPDADRAGWRRRRPACASNGPTSSTAVIDVLASDDLHRSQRWYVVASDHSRLFFPSAPPWRRRKVPLPINKTIQELTDAQDGRCVICGGFLFAVEDRPQNPREWEKWLTITGQTINTIATREPSASGKAEPRLVHAACRESSGLALHNAYVPSGLA
jgi:hypothetical protein